MLTRISAITAVVIAIVNLAVLFGVNITDQQLAGINVVVAAIGSAIHVWFNPNVAPNKGP